MQIHVYDTGEIHDKLMLISHVFLFDMVCAVLSSFQLQGSLV